MLVTIVKSTRLIFGLSKDKKFIEELLFTSYAV